MFEGPLHVALLRTVRMRLLYCYLDQHRMWTDSKGRINDLETQIATMRASRFWKLRNRWFELKRRLGLTDEL